jgi:predicted nucleotidyltransferase
MNATVPASKAKLDRIVFVANHDDRDVAAAIVSWDSRSMWKQSFRPSPAAHWQLGRSRSELRRRGGLRS